MIQPLSTTRSNTGPRLGRRALLTGGAAMLALSACRNDPETPVDPNAPPEGSLAWAVTGDWRTPQDRRRDAWRHPVETLEFFEIEPADTVVEVWPGAGWWTEVLAPYLARGGGKLYAAGFEVDRPEPGEEAQSSTGATSQIEARYREHFTRNRRIYGDVEMTAFGPAPSPIAPPGSADLVLFMSNLHLWMAAGLAEKAFTDAWAALKPDGVLGVEQHRASVGQTQDPAAADGYVQEAFVKQLAAEAGFAFVAASEVNANPADTRDHPFGVWTLPPTLQTAPRGEAPNSEFDTSLYRTIGESDRMTLKFRKPPA